MPARELLSAPVSERRMAPQRILELYERMWRIRVVEERIKDEYASRRIRGPVHLSIGQEAIAVGVLSPCRQADVCLSTHRNHAHYLAKGGGLTGMVHELYGLPSGSCKGYGGSMHLFDRQANVLLSSAVVAGSVPIAAGIAFALKRDGTDGVCISFVGDGGTDEGVFYETLNLAALLKLPVFFVVENNGVSTLTPLAKRQAVPDVVSKAERFGVQGMRVDGNDAVEVAAASQQILECIRRSGEPLLLEAVTYRLCAHVGPAVYTSGIGADEELLTHLEQEPLKAFKARIRSDYPELIEACAKREQAVSEEVHQVFEEAKRRFDEEAVRVGLPPPPPPPDPRRV
ncbi:MAG: thiamine pyrophosphate-dependent dehydrogenase E1 component subunit alpha [Candidatus Omnitrophica bacterium]|nr:thiamine pyrophosphate-dependent dehydrogenase E1 component subunit alpha [Candidatus Omnitrophota bacterium]